MKITFRRNYEMKLEANTYLAILPYNHEHRIGLNCDIFVATKKHHEATIIHCEPMNLTDIKKLQFITILDVGLSAEEYIKIIEEHRPLTHPEETFLELLIFKKTPSKTNEKIALFCSKYEKFTGIKYKISKAEIGIIAKTEVTEELIQKFFTCNEFWAKVKSVSYYCKNINEIKRLTTINAANNFPNFYDADYTKRLEGPELSAYYKHLRSLNLVAKKNSLGNIIDFVLKSNL